MNNKQILVLINFYAEKFLKEEFNTSVEDLYLSNEKNEMEIIRWNDSTVYELLFEDALKKVKPHHEKLIIFTDSKLKKMIFEDSEAEPCDELKIVINVVDYYDGSPDITFEFQINDYPVEYIFFNKLIDNMFKTYSFKTNEEITINTFIEALKDEQKYIELSLKLNSRIFKIDENMDFTLLENMISEKDKKFKKNYKIVTEFEIQDHITNLYNLINKNCFKQKYLNLINYMENKENKTIENLIKNSCLIIKKKPDRTIIYHKV